MAKLRLFQTAILFHPNEEEIKNGKNTEIVQVPTTVLAKDEKSAAMKANLAIPEKYHEQLDQIEVIVVNF
jgi:hypothetical protein